MCIKIWYTFWWLDLVLGVDQEDTNLLANVFFKHQERVLKEFYTMNWCHREAVRLSWKCHQRVGVSSYEKEIAAVVEQLQSKMKPSVITIKKWYKRQKELVYKKSGEVYQDRNLEAFLDVEENLQGIEDEICKFQK